MSWYRRFTNLLRSNRHSRDLDREIGFHLAERADDLVASGMSEDAAGHEAQRRFGNRGALKERTRDVDTFAWLDALLADIRQAVRALRANRGFAFVAVLSLGLGIGANTAIFSLINAVMLKSLPVNHPETLLRVVMGKNDGILTNPIWEQLRDRRDLFSATLAYGTAQYNLASGGEARRVEGDQVSGDFFTVLGVRTVMGRPITRADDVRGCSGIAVVSYGFWQTEYGGAPNAIGSTLLLDRHPFTVVGVVDPSFSGMDVGRATQIYTPLCTKAITDGRASTMDERASWFLTIVVRPLAGTATARTMATLAAASPAVFQATLPPNWSASSRAQYLQNVLRAEPAANGFSELRLQYIGALRVLMVVVALVLLIACANVANLLLARATARQHEAAIRLALGAGRARLIRQMLTEALLLSALGTAVGIVFASWGSRLLTSFLSMRGGAVWLDLGVDRRTLVFTAAVALASGIIFGLAPAWRSAEADPQDALKANGRNVGGRSHRSFGRTLVIGQVALSFVLLTSAGLLLGSFRNLMSRDPGFRAEGLLLASAQVSDTNAGFPTALLNRLRTMPGVHAAALSLVTPFSSRGWNGYLLADGYHPANQRDALAFFNGVSDGYFATTGTPLVAGRDVGPGDVAGAPKVAIINRAVAHQLFGTADPIGRQFRTPEGDHESDPFTVIGVVQDSKYRSLRDSAFQLVYVPMAQAEIGQRSFTMALRGDAAPSALIPGVKSLMTQMAPKAPLEFTTMSDLVARSLNRDRLLATLAAFFGALALLLALIGLYGTMAYSVARRKSEIGIRIALGAAQQRVVQMVLGEVGGVVLAGLGVGVLLALAATRLVASFLFGLTAGDPVTWIASAGVLLVVALLAAAVPAWRATRMNPMTALREE